MTKSALITIRAYIIMALILYILFKVFTLYLEPTFIMLMDVLAFYCYTVI